MVGTAQVEGVTAVHVVVQSLLYQILRLVACQLGYPEKRGAERGGWERNEERCLSKCVILSATASSRTDHIFVSYYHVLD